ncbi:hypothetical protein E4T38_07275, partial [Aureobasidium subglaciale]
REKQGQVDLEKNLTRTIPPRCSFFLVSALRVTTPQDTINHDQRSDLKMPSSIEPLSLPSSTITPAQTTFEDGVPEIKDVPALGPKKTGSPSKPLPKRLSHRSSWLRYPHWPASSSSTQCLPTSENCGLNQHQPCDTWLLLLLLLLLLLEVAVFLIKRTVPTESRCFISSSQRVLSLEGEWQRGNLTVPSHYGLQIPEVCIEREEEEHLNTCLPVYCAVVISVADPMECFYKRDISQAVENVWKGAAQVVVTEFCKETKSCIRRVSSVKAV